MPEYIPWQELRELAERIGLRQVVMIAWDGERTHVVTYGVTAEESDQAAQGGNRVRRALGWPEVGCNAQSPKVAELRRRIADLECQIEMLLTRLAPR